jgi:AraC-like DNA-binding protein
VEDIFSVFSLQNTSKYPCDNSIEEESIDRRVLRSLASSDLNLVRAHDIAQKLKISGRTMSRRLAECDTSYNDLLNTHKKELLVQMLKRGRNVDNIAETLGYKEMNSFYRAVRRWYGTGVSNLPKYIDHIPTSKG